ncbi:hypothetical protein DWF00_16570 [Bosea caraganae]|uniref:Uncharacterized protein n=1 Tax=Bosea caraganae TaxID=2763117 RepID=A0A370KYR4_9HYPH|nr:hypothetical protein [Bosea caraganae]RDJ20123.1 hypothetical protein DWE98_26175 [Bosea caraganae]RDJ24835.1 hypothetical protein DWF00_16570 [Bosea caraganae]
MTRKLPARDEFFDVYGPYDIEVDGTQVPASQKALWEQVREEEGLEESIGCYMFCIRRGGIILPWYIGMTVAVKGFRGETFTPHKIDIYNDCLQRQSGQPQLFIFPFMIKPDENANLRFSLDRTRGRRIIKWLEKTLMGMALSRNDELANLRDASLPRSVSVRGVLGAPLRGRPSTDVAEARRALLGGQ